MDDPGATYVKAAANGDLRSHVVGALWWERGLGVEQVEDLVGRREALSGGRFQARGVKVMQDGVAENFTAAMLTPYLDADGRDDRQPRSLVRRGRRAARGGGRSGRGGLPGARPRHRRPRLPRGARRVRGDARPGNRRHHIAHIQVVHPDDVRGSPALGVAANAQALWACLTSQMAELTIPFLGAERSTWQYPFADLHRAGARLVMGSDWPVSTPDPLQAIHVAVNRAAYGEHAEAFLPEQAIDLETAFAAYTSGSAWINRRDELDGAGVLAPGAAADLVVLDRDPFAGPAEEIGATTVASSWIDGELSTWLVEDGALATAGTASALSTGVSRRLPGNLLNQRVLLHVCVVGQLVVGMGLEVGADLVVEHRLPELLGGRLVDDVDRAGVRAGSGTRPAAGS